MTETTISIDNVTKVFRPSPGWLRVLIKSPLETEIKALDSVSFQVNRGEVCALVGPNGAGKTTLFRILIGLTTPTSGQATVLGSDVVNDSLAIRRQVGWMPTANETLFQRHTVAANLRFQGRVYGLSGSVLERAIDDTLEMVELTRAKDNAVVSLSTGMKARLRLGRALLHKPRLLILDEPTASVDPVGSLSLMNLILSVVDERDMSAIISSHRLDEIEALSSHVLLLHRGAVLYDGDLSGLRPTIDQPRYQVDFSSPRHAKRAADALNEHPLVISVHAGGSALELSLKAGAQLGAAMAALGSELAEVVSTHKIEMPLREVLADVYGVADRGGGG